MKRSLPLVLAGLFILGLGLSGCEDSPSYSSLVQYGVRGDPLMVASQPGQLGEDQYEPDRPGVFPILHAGDVNHANNPLSSKGNKLYSENLLRDPALIPAADRQKLDQALTELFGTPADPKVGELSAEESAKLGLDAATLKEGSRHYRVHCVHCHGVPGDGRGPTARWISPHPRDFRQGLFKFMSVDQTKGTVDLPPRREDLLHTIRHGIEGTAMPAFLLLKSKELDQLVSYVIHLSMRGRTEFDLLAKSYEWTTTGGTTSVKFTDEGSIAESVKGWHQLNTKRWVDSQDPKNWIQIPPDYFNEVGKASFKDPKGEGKVWTKLDDGQRWKVRGAIAVALFNDTPPSLPEARQILDARGDKTAAVKCVQCHIDYGRQAKFKFDSWATLVRPNNFTNGLFRGGRRPADIYHRIHSAHPTICKRRSRL